MKVLRKISLVVVSFLMALLPMNTVFAKLPESLLYYYAQNNILFYDPTGCIMSSSSPKPSTP